MELYHCLNARSIRVVWTLEELGGRFAYDAGGYKLHTLPFPPRMRYRPFMKTNPLGTVPYFADAGTVVNKTSGITSSGNSTHGNGGGSNNSGGSSSSSSSSGGSGSGGGGGVPSMTESCAIPLYLTSRYGGPNCPLAVAPHEAEYGQFLDWLFHADATLTFPQTVVLRYTVQEPGRADAAAADYAKWYLARLRKLDAALADGREFLVAGRFTIADICVTFALFMGANLQASLEEGEEPLSAKYKPQTARYLERMIARPAFARAQAAQERSADEFEARIEAEEAAAEAASASKRSKL